MECDDNIQTAAVQWLVLAPLQDHNTLLSTTITNN